MSNKTLPSITQHLCYIQWHIQGDSVAKGPKLLSIKIIDSVAKGPKLLSIKIIDSVAKGPKLLSIKIIDSVAKGPKLLSIKHYVIEIMT